MTEKWREKSWILVKYQRIGALSGKKKERKRRAGNPAGEALKIASLRRRIKLLYW